MSGKQVPAGGHRAMQLFVLDYPGRRPEPRIRELGLDRRGFEPSELITAPLPEEVTAREYAEQLLARVPPQNGAAAILAYCAAAALAQACARLLVEAGGDPPPLVMFNAGPVTVRDVCECYESARHQVAPGCGEPRSSAVDVESLIASPHALLDAVRADLARCARDSLRSSGFPEDDIADVAGESVRVYTNWLSHLLAAYHCTSSYWGGEVLHVVSSDHPFRGHWSGARSTRTVEIACDRLTLLHAEEARTAVLSFLEKV